MCEQLAPSRYALARRLEVETATSWSQILCPITIYRLTAVERKNLDREAAHGECRPLPNVDKARWCYRRPWRSIAKMQAAARN